LSSVVVGAPGVLGLLRTPAETSKPGMSTNGARAVHGRAPAERVDGHVR